MIISHQWKDMEEGLVTAAKDAIAQFRDQHPQETCSFFACACLPDQDDFVLGIDTWDNALITARKWEATIVAQRNLELSQEPEKDSGELEPWQYALSLAKEQQILDYTPNIRQFPFLFPVPGAKQWFVGWRDPRSHGLFIGEEDGYLAGSICLVLWKVMERLVAEEAFAQLRLSSPFRVGYQFHFDNLVIVRQLNWPYHKEG